VHDQLSAAVAALVTAPDAMLSPSPATPGHVRLTPDTAPQQPSLSPSRTESSGSAEPTTAAASKDSLGCKRRARQSDEGESVEEEDRLKGLAKLLGLDYLLEDDACRSTSQLACSLRQSPIRLSIAADHTCFKGQNQLSS